NKNVIQSSYYMSDSLCHALIDHEELVETNAGIYNGLVGQMDTLTNNLASKEAELVQLKNDLNTISQMEVTMQFDKVMLFDKYIFTGTSVTSSFQTKDVYKYAVLIKVE